MELKDLQLKPEEIQMEAVGTSGDYFLIIPIYPALLRKDIELQTSAVDIFPKAVAETEKELGHSPKLFYEVIYWENGLARELMLNEHVGLLTQVNGRFFLPPQYANFSEEKQEAYSTTEEGIEYLLDDLVGPPFVYQTKNANKVHATLLKSWSINYLNDALKEIIKQNRI